MTSFDTLANPVLNGTSVYFILWTMAKCGKHSPGGVVFIFVLYIGKVCDKHCVFCILLKTFQNVMTIHLNAFLLFS